MSALYPSINDSLYDVIKKIANNTAEIDTSIASDVASIAGTANQITVSQPTGNVTLSIPAVFIAPGSLASTTTVKAGSSFIGLNSQTIIGNSLGAWAIAANGTNQSITLTPSGTGQGLINTAYNGLVSNFASGSFSLTNSNNATGLSLGTFISSGANADSMVSIGNGAQFIGTIQASKALSNVVAALSLNPNGGNVLINGVTNGTGVLQFPTATTSAGGVGFGTDTFFFRGGAGIVTINATGTTAKLNFTNSGIGAAGANITLGSTTMTIANTEAGTIVFATNGATNLTLAADNSINVAKKISSYNGVATTGWGVGAIQAAAEVTAQSGAGTITSYTNGAADGTYRVSAQVNVTAVTALSTTVTCTYTDKSNTSRVMIMPVQQLTGSFIAGGLITGTGAWETPVMHIRCKASTAITIATTAGTFTGVTFSADAIIQQVA